MITQKAFMIKQQHIPYVSDDIRDNKQGQYLFRQNKFKILKKRIK
jgi:hypothetical protein